MLQGFEQMNDFQKLLVYLGIFWWIGFGFAILRGKAGAYLKGTFNFLKGKITQIFRWTWRKHSEGIIWAIIAIGLVLYFLCQTGHLR